MDLNNSLDSLLKGLMGVVSDEKKNIKIFKSANKKSILDVTSSLNYHKSNQKKEEVYKGKIIFSITEIEKRKYLKAFVDKAKVKVLMQSIIDHTFNRKVFNGGFTDFGGTMSSNPNKVRSRILKINLTDRNQFVLNINEGRGKLGETGNIEMIGKPELTVTRFVPYEEALQMAHEVYDYIRDQETLALIKGKPLYTITNYEGNRDIQSSINEESNSSEKVNEEQNEEQNEENQELEYEIPIDPWKGKMMGELTNQEIKYILEKTKNVEKDIAKELYKEASKEAKKRMEKSSIS